MAVFKPSPVHWARFAEEVAKQNVLDDFIQLGASQALWQFANTLGVVISSKSTREAKENAVVTLIYINVTRMALAQLLSSNTKTILSQSFLEKLSKVQSDEDMTNFVKTEFIPILKLPSSMPNVNMDWLQLVRSHEPMEQLHKYLEKNVSISARMVV